MMLTSKLDKPTYLYELRKSLSSPTDFGIERFTGFVFGSFFCVTHHCSYEWNRRITSEKNTAIGFVTKNSTGTEICCINTKGELRPQFLLPWELFSILILRFLSTEAGLYLSILGLFAACISAIFDSLTEEGKAGHNNLISLLIDPKNPYENL